MIKKAIKLSTGGTMPLIGLGTWQLRGAECTRTVQTALKLGYRHIDTAHVYLNHQDIARGIADFDRSELFLVSKLSIDQLEEGKIEKSVGKAVDLALHELETPYLDLYLIHWPDRSKEMDRVLLTMQELKEEGKLRAIGVSNFTIHHLEDALETGVEIAVNQVEFHPYLFQKKLGDFCKNNGIEVVSYRPFGKGAILDDHVLEDIGKKYRKTPAQTILRWLVQREITAIPKASSESHLYQNLNVFDFELAQEEMHSIDRLNRNFRYCDASWSEFDY